MNQRSLLAIAALFVVVGLVATGSALAIGGPGPVDFPGLFGESNDPPMLVHFSSAGAHCTDDFMANSSTSVVVGADNTEITHSRNVSLPGPSHAIGGPTFERLNDSTYVLNVPIEETEKAPRSCPGVARYNGTMRIPAGDDPWQLIIKHDGRRVTTLYGDSNQSLLGGSANAGQSVSAPQPTTNSTSTSE